MVRKTKKIMETTTNRRVYNIARKKYISGKNGDCSFCKYHRGENYDGKQYGGRKDGRITYPNWKLVSKNEKQWMEKPIKEYISKIHDVECVNFKI